MATFTGDVDNTVPFYKGTRLKTISNLNQMVKPSPGGGKLTQQLPRVGMLQGIWLDIQVTIADHTTGAAALGVCAAVPQIRVVPNSANDLVNISAAGYSNLLDYCIGTEFFPAMGSTQNQGRAPVTDGVFNLNMYLPIALNCRDPYGLFSMQNEESVLNLEITFAADSAVTGDGTVAVVVNPRMDILTVFDPKILPPLGLIHTLVEDTRQVSGAGDYIYEPLRGQIYLQIMHGLGIANSGAAADGFDRFRVIVGNSDVWKDVNPRWLSMENHKLRGAGGERLPGTFIQDYLGTSELGTMGLNRDVFDTKDITAYQHVITATGAGTLYTIRRQFLRAKSMGQQGN